MKKRQKLLTDEQWELVEPMLPPPRRRQDNRGRPWASNRPCFEGILWILRTGARWQDISVDLPSGSTCWRRLRDWAGEGVLPDIQALLIEELDELGKIDFDELFADATFIRAKKGAKTSGKPRPARV